MKRAPSPKRRTATTRQAARQKKCPYCAEVLGVRKIHVCPAGCCYVAVGKESHEAICPYCDNSFETGIGHVCLELIKLNEPAQ